MTTTDPETALAWWALALFAVYLTLGFVLRSVLQYRATGDTGFRGISGPVGSPRWWAGVLFVLALLTGVLGPSRRWSAWSRSGCSATASAGRGRRGGGRRHRAHRPWHSWRWAPGGSGCARANARHW